MYFIWCTLFESNVSTRISLHCKLFKNAKLKHCFFFSLSMSFTLLAQIWSSFFSIQSLFHWNNRKKIALSHWKRAIRFIMFYVAWYTYALSTFYVGRKPMISAGGNHSTIINDIFSIESAALKWRFSHDGWKWYFWCVLTQ